MTCKPETIRTRRRLLGEWNFHSDPADFQRMPVEDATPNEFCFKLARMGRPRHIPHRASRPVQLACGASRVFLSPRIRDRREEVDFRRAWVHQHSCRITDSACVGWDVGHYHAAAADNSALPDGYTFADGAPRPDPGIPTDPDGLDLRCKCRSSSQSVPEIHRVAVTVADGAVRGDSSAILDHHFLVHDESHVRTDGHLVPDDEFRVLVGAAAVNTDFATDRNVIADFNVRMTSDIGKDPEEQPFADTIAAAPEERLGIEENTKSAVGSRDRPVERVHSPQQRLGGSGNREVNPQKSDRDPL